MNHEENLEQQPKPLEQPKNLPFNVETLLKEVGESAKRSRSILLLLIFTSLLVFMALVNSSPLKLNWYKSKIELNKNVYQFIIFPKDKIDFFKNDIGKIDTLRPMNSLAQFVYTNELNIRKASTAIEKIEESTVKRELENEHYNLKYPMQGYFRLQNPAFCPILNATFKKRQEIYKEIGRSINYVVSENIDNGDIVKATLTRFTDLRIEYLDLVRVPILGISFHVNLLGIYSGFILIVLYLLFLFSIFREHTNLKITFKRGWLDMKNHPYYLYEYASMQQVLSMPRKLFGTTKRKEFDFLSSFVHYFAYIIYFPFAVYSLVLFNDILTIDIGIQANPLLTWLTIGINSLFLIITLYLCTEVRHRWEKMDVLWLNQSIEFNLEFILASIKEDDKRDLIELVRPLLIEEDKQEVKALYYEMIEKAIEKKIWYFPFIKNWQERKSTKRSLQTLERFLDIALSEEFAKESKKKRSNEVVKQRKTYKRRKNVTNNDDIELYWTKLKEWFNIHGRKNVGSSFGKTFKEMILELRKMN